MPVTRLLVEGELDAQLLAPLFAGNPVVEPIKSSKNALAPRTRTERQKMGPCVSYLRDRDFDYKPPTQLNQPTVDKIDNDSVLGWRWRRHSIENYMLEPGIVCAALGVENEPYCEALCESGNRIKYYQAARWAIGIARRVRIADFRPEVGTIQKEQVEKVTEEFGRFLEAQFTDNEEDEDFLPMLQLE